MVLLPDVVRPGLLRRAEEFLNSFAELLTVLGRRGGGVNSPMEVRTCRRQSIMQEKALHHELDFAP